MKAILRLRFIILIFLLIVCSNLLAFKTLDHEIFLQEIENSSDTIYMQCIKKYEDYLKKFPDDVSVNIEKCKFIQFAQYDDSDDYNPNQEAFDSCCNILIKKFPNHSEVLIFQTTYTWGDDLKEVFVKAEKSVQENPMMWSKENLGNLYLKISNQYYWNDEYQLAYKYIKKAIHQDRKHKSSLDYARILIMLDKKEEALEALLSGQDTTNITWELSQKATLLLDLKAYSNALNLYNLIDSIDSTFNNNYELANTLEGVGEYNFARTYLIADTSQNWDKETAFLNLLIHDLKYQEGILCIQTYNEYRDFGFLMDPIGIYRLKLFFSHPFESWEIRDLIGVLTLILIFILLIILPSIWILPVYFIGHKWNFLEKNKTSKTIWGLKAFWFVSSGYLIASLFALMTAPDYLYSLFSASYYEMELSQDRLGFMSIIFIAVFAFFGLATLYKKSTNILLSSLWPIRKSIVIGFGTILIFRLFIGIYVKLGVNYFGISLDDIANIPNCFLSSSQEIEAIISNYGKLLGFFIVCVFVPIYEEIIFRGVIFDACQRYINFNSANLIQSALFATIHTNLFLFPIFFIFGIISGFLRRKSGGLLPGIVFHIINNTFAISVLLFR